MESRDFFYRLGKAIYKIDSHYSNFAKKQQIKPNLLWILYALNDDCHHTQKRICKEWGLPITTINTIIKELEREKIVKLEKIKGKKREMHILLTDNGKNMANRVLFELYGIESLIFNKIKNEAKSLILYLEKLESEMNKIF